MLPRLLQTGALLVAAALLAWTSLLFRKLRTTQHGMLWLLPKVSAGSFILETTVAGASGALLGVVTRSRSVAFAYALVTLVAGIPLLQTWRTPDIIADAFGTDAKGVARRYRVGRRLGIRLGSVPAPRVRRDIPFWTSAETGRTLVCDIWQPAIDVVPSGLGLIYLHGSAWTVLDKDCGTRALFSQLSAQGHVIMDVAYRLYPETDMVGMVGDAKRAIVWLKR